MPPTTPQDRKRPAKKTTARKASARQADPIPVPEEPDSKYAPNAWLSGGVGGMEDLEVPSGQLCLVRRPGLQGLMQAGVLRNIDSLSAIVSRDHIKRAEQGGKASSDEEIDVESIMGDPEALDQIMHTVDRVVCHCVVKPEVHMTPNDVTRRQPGVVYADMIDLNDKMFIFNFVVGGTRDLETFRAQRDGLVGSVAAVEGVPDEAE